VRRVGGRGGFGFRLGQGVPPSYGRELGRSTSPGCGKPLSTSRRRSARAA
jgi:hypothetical protein